MIKTTHTENFLGTFVMSYIQGWELPHGTVVYYKANNAAVYRTVIGHTTAFMGKYSLDADGILASVYARNFWDRYPQCHPMCTLFDILYKNPDLWNLE
jgi:hypothetical protein